MSRFSVAFRLLAVVLLLCIGQDLAADALCDQRIAMASDIEVVSANSTGESCSTICVPDCFCCCIGAESNRPSVMTNLGRITNPTEQAPESPLDGVSVSIFHPPLLRA
jgi:hypothetical protein